MVLERELTRRVLFDLVWARPMTQVAADFGLSDVALHKICKKHRVPAPGRGYWAKVAAGKPVTPARFTEIEGHDLDRIVIRGHPMQRMPDEVVEAREQAKARTKSRGGKAAPPSVPDHETADRLIERMREALARARAGGDGMIHASGQGLVPVSIDPSSTERALNLLETLIRRAGENGYTFEVNDTGAGLVVEGETVSLGMVEKTTGVTHRPTEQERERRLHHELWVSDRDEPQSPASNDVPGGRLVIEIDHGNHWDGLRRRFSDGKRRRLEDMIDTVLVGVATCAAAIKAEREKAERRKRECEEDEKRRREAERRRILEAKRREFLEHLMTRQDHACRIAAFLEAYLARHPERDLPDSTRALIDWARKQELDLRREIAPDRLAEILDRHRLMDDATEIGA